MKFWFIHLRWCQRYWICYLIFICQLRNLSGYVIVFEFSFYFKETAFTWIFSNKIILFCLPWFCLKMLVRTHYCYWCLSLGFKLCMIIWCFQRNYLLVLNDKKCTVPVFLMIYLNCIFQSESIFIKERTALFNDTFCLVVMNHKSDSDNFFCASHHFYFFLQLCSFISSNYVLVLVLNL